jgi:hypothetical protein
MVKVNVCGMMTSPRYINCFCRDHIDAAFRGAGIPLQDMQGVFYGQCMQRMMQMAIESDTDLAVVCDGDSLFTTSDIMRLIGTITASDHIDALASMQVRRGNSTLLASLDGKSEVQVAGDPVKVSTAHFGLTVIDLRKLATTEKPWFFSKPDENGEWGNGRIDDDIWFWRQWEKAGNSVYLDPNTRIGHMEEMVVMVDPVTYQAVHAYPSEWVDSCKSNC